MALEMVDDPQDSNEDNGGSGGGSFGGFGSSGGGGGFGLGSILNFLPLAFGLFGNRGGGSGNDGRGKGGCGSSTLLIVVLLVGGYFLLRNQSCGNLSNLSAAVSQFTKGGKLDPNEFKKASVYEGLEDDNTKNPLPESVSLLRFAPERQNQGKQGSCVAWSSGYAARSIVESASTAKDPNSVAFSPAFLYNQIGMDGCQGSFINKAMEFMTQKGAVPFNDFPYDETNCSRQPTNQLLSVASQNKMHGFNRLTEGDGVNNLSLRAIKEHLAKDAPVVIGMMVGGTFMEGMMGQKLWHPTNKDYNQTGFGGHALCVIGYDDRLEGGSFQIMNSWGKEWGENGIGWIRYNDFKEFVREAYGIDPMPKRGAALNIAFECSIGLVDNDTKKYIALQAGNANIFSNTEPIKKGTRFKIEIKNALECYIYLFTPNPQGISFVLFPYKPIHSPYCGITGYRLFPKGQSIRADSLGNKDFMGIVVSKEAIDYNAINTSINNSSQSTYAAKLNEVISNAAVKNVKFASTSTGTINFKADTTANKKMVGFVVEIAKQ